MGGNSEDLVGAVVLRPFVDGPPTESMVAARKEALDVLTPASIGRWPSNGAGRFALAQAAYESGYDTACLRMMEVIRDARP